MLKTRAAAAVTEMLKEADVNGNFPSTHYSLGDGAIAFFVHSGWIYNAVFQSWDFLSTEQRQSLVEQATRSFNSFESDWMNYGYRFPPGSDLYLDGVVQPFNMQAAMGMLALDLRRATGEARFLDRAEAVFNLIIAEFVTENGTAFWRYWPSLFTDGWSAGTFESLNAPTRPPFPITSFEDVHHALITIPFLLEAGEALGRDVIDVQALFASINLGGLNFAAELNGAVGGYEFLPYWPDAAALWPYLTREMPSVLPHYDQAVTDWMYAGSARRSGVTASTQIEIETLDPQTGQVTGRRTLTGPAEILAYVQANDYARDPVAAGSIDLATDDHDTYTGTVEPDSVRLLDGNDTAAMGDGDDLVMGDFGDDTLSGEAGDDALYGGFGADVLNGGAGDDLLSGQAGEDILRGGPGQDALVGGGVTDTADYSGSADRIAVSFAGKTALGGDAHGDTLVSIENLVGTNSVFTDFLTGNDDANVLSGLAGDDDLEGLGENDTPMGGEGADKLDGGDGDDTLIGGKGDDFILKGPDGSDGLTGIESIRFGDGRVLELNRMYGPNVDAQAWSDGRIPETIPSDGRGYSPLPLVLPGVGDPDIWGSNRLLKMGF